MLINNFAKYSGKGTPMISRRGKGTICLYACFKQGLTDEEKSRTGLKPALEEKLIEQILKKDKYSSVEPKVYSKQNNNS